jgi:hypothetical protein
VCRGQGTTYHGDLAVLGSATIVLVMVVMVQYLGDGKYVMVTATMLYKGGGVLL